MDKEAIDPKLRNVIEELNKVGLKTKYSCQGGHGTQGGSPYTYISFDTNKIKGFHLIVDQREDSLIIYWNP